MAGTVLIRWEKGYEEKLAMVTDLEEKAGHAAWYQMRFWIEDEYKDHKSGGWGWAQTKMTDPKRAERQWKALAVAMQMAVLVGGQEEACEWEYKPKKARKSLQKRRRGRPPKLIQRPRGREQSVLVRGQQTIHTAVVRGEEIPEGHVVTEEWPKQTYRVGKPTKSWASKCKEKEAKQRHQKNKQARAGQGESTPTQAKPGKKQQYPNPAKQARKRERVKQEQAAKRLLREQEREKRKREQEEHRLNILQERKERKRKKEHKRERRLRERREREQERLWRLCWHEEIRQERERRLARKLQRIVRQASTALAQPSAVSMIFVDSQALASLPNPP